MLSSFYPSVQNTEIKDSKDPARTRKKDAKTRKENAKKGIIELSLPEELEFFFSSDDYASLLEAGLSSPDLISTWGLRYAGVLQSILSGSGTVGCVIKYLSEHPYSPVTILLGMTMVIASSIDTYSQYQTIQEAYEKRREALKQLREKLGLENKKEINAEHQLEETNEEKLKKINDFNKNLQSFIALFNETLPEILAEEGNEEFENIQIVPPQESGKKIKIQEIKIRYNFKIKSDKKDSEEKKEDKNEKIKDEKKEEKKNEKKSEGIEQPGIVRRFFSTVYRSMGLSAFSYWILFITSAVFTGGFADAGILGLYAGLAFGIPALLALPYVGLKIRNYIRHRNGVSDEHAWLAKKAENDAPEIFLKTLRRVQFKKTCEQIEAQKAEYEKFLQQKHVESKKTEFEKVTKPKDDSIGANAKVQAAATLYTSFVSQYGMTQYNAWIISDLFKVWPIIPFSIPFFGQIMGGILIGVGLGFALYDAYNKYKEVKKSQPAVAQDSSAVESPKTFQTLDAIFIQRQQTLLNLNAERKVNLTELNTYCNQYKTELNTYCDQQKIERLKISPISPLLKRPVPSLTPPHMSAGQKVWNFFGKVRRCFDWAATGIFFGRAIATLGTAVYLPAAALALSNPVTIGILIGSGLIYLGIKVYQAYQKSKEEDAKALIEKIKEMDEQIKVAELTKESIELKRKVVNEIMKDVNEQNKLAELTKESIESKRKVLNEIMQEKGVKSIKIEMDKTKQNQSEKHQQQTVGFDAAQQQVEEKSLHGSFFGRRQSLLPAANQGAVPFQSSIACS